MNSALKKSTPVRSVVANTLAEGDSVEIIDTPDVKNRHSLSFRADVVSMGKLRLSHGTKGYVAGIIEIDSEYIYVYKNSDPSEVEKTISHGISISEYIHVLLAVGVKFHEAKVTLTTSAGQSFTCDIAWNGCSDNVTLSCIDGNYTNVNLTFGGDVWKEKVWIFGDSYTDSWPKFAQSFGATKFLLDGYSGRNSLQAYDSLLKEMLFGTPDVILWMMGMNDQDSDTAIHSYYRKVFDWIKEICENNGIEFIPCTIPNVPERVHTFKNEYIKNNSTRYIDLAQVLGAEEAGSSWRSGLLSVDKVHPTDAGAKLIVQTLCEEIPQIVDYSTI